MRRVLFYIPLPFGWKPLPIFAYGTMLMIGFLSALYLARRRAKRAGIEPDVLTDVALVTLLSGVLGARLFFVIEFRRHMENGLLEFFKIWEGGLVFYGGFLGALAALIVYVRRRGLPLAGLLDVIAPSLMLGLAFGRIGCFLNGCCYGRPTHLPWAVVFPHGALAYQPPNALPPGTAVHPTQLYESLGAFLAYIVLEIYFRRKHRRGQVALLLCMLYPVLRFILEFLRADTHVPLKWGPPGRYEVLPPEAYLMPQELAWKGLSTSQAVSIVVFAGALAAWLLWPRLSRRAPEAGTRSARRAQTRRKAKAAPPMQER